MAYDPWNCQVHAGAVPKLPEGHLAFRANDYDREFCLENGIMDPVEAARLSAFEAAVAVNLSGERTPEVIERADKLSRIAASMATEANLALIGSTQR